MLLSVILDLSTTDGDHLEVDVLLNGSGGKPQFVPLAGLSRAGTIEIDFGRYPSGETLSVNISLLRNGTVVGAGMGSRLVQGQCENLTVVVSDVARDLSVASDSHSLLDGSICQSSSECPANMACQPESHQCTKNCEGGLPCHGGCCQASLCVAGESEDACGSSGGACVRCGDGAPSCSGGACVTACVPGLVGAPRVCGSGFCCDAQSKCAAIANSVCAPSGSSCVDCTTTPERPACLPDGTCGCTRAQDCPTGQACMGGLCGTSCSVKAPCNGGCCDFTKCVVGRASGSCGSSGQTCTPCILANPSGRACIFDGNNAFCGCNINADCQSQRCDPNTHMCN